MTAMITVPPRRVADRARTHRTTAADEPRARRGAVSARTYARRRAVVGGVTAALAALTLVAGFDIVVADRATPAAAASVSVSAPAGAATVVARPGDTLWSIAEANRGDVAVRRYVDALIDLNGGPSIQAGQRVKLP